MQKIVIVSAADTKYFPLLQGLVLSVRDTSSFRETPIYILDVGLAQDERDWLSARNARAISIGWDFDFLERAGLPSHTRAQSARPFLPDHVPGFDVYLWMDADTWVQDERAVDLAIQGALKSQIAVAPEINRLYRAMYMPGKTVRPVEYDTYMRCFGAAAAEQLVAVPLINSGFFSATRDSPLWAMWREHLGPMYETAPSFFTEQCALNVCIYMRQLSMFALPAHCNWICHQALPAVDTATGLFVEPAAPYQPIWLMHMVGIAKDGEHDLATTSGGGIRRSLRYNAGRIGSP